MKTNNRQKMAELAYELRGCIFELHKEIGPGLLETVYERLLTHLLVEKGIKVRNQVPIPLIYTRTEVVYALRL